MHFSIGEAWSYAVQFLRDNLSRLLLYVALPTILVTVLQLTLGLGNPGFQALASGGGSDPAAVLRSLSPAFGVVTLLGAVFTGAMQFAVMRLMLRSEASDGSAISFGLGAMVMTMLFFLVIAIPLVLILVTVFAGASTTGSVGIVALLGLVLFPVLLWVSSRLSVMQPAMADAGSANPLYGIAQSWKLTAPVQWRVLAYILLFAVIVLVLTLLLGAIGSLLGAAFGGTVATAVANLVASIPVSILSVAVIAGLYRALNPSRVGDVFA